MGFGEKTDPADGKTYNLDKTYQNVIKPVVEACGYRSIRGDEIRDSGLIDKSMYALLIRADLVIADITTLNANAMYELGIRHAARPKSTIILKNEGGQIPFDLSHNRLLMYKHLGEDIGCSDAEIFKSSLTSLIKSIEQHGQVDSPFFTYLSEMNPHNLSDKDYDNVIEHLLTRENSIFALSEKARILRSEKKFIEAADYWKKASEIAPEDHYFIHQQTLCTYKSEHPSKEASLLSALEVIAPIHNSGETNDPETLGLVGAIYKRLYELSGDIETLKMAIQAYERGYTVSDNYYTGENFATCLDSLADKTTNPKEKIYCEFTAEKIRNQIIESLLRKLIGDIEYPDKKWMYATLANCYFHLGNKDAGDDYKQKFLNEKPEQWEQETSLYMTKTNHIENNF
jgi:tetratricopeptide (TPR) repeat protein